MWNPLAYDRDFAKLLQFLRSKIWFHWNNIILPSKLLGKFCLLMPCPFTGPKMFCAGPNFLSQPKNLNAFSASHCELMGEERKICNYNFNGL